MHPHPWIIAQNEDVIAHEWHEKYSLGETKVLGDLAYAGSHLKLRVLVVQNIIGRQQRGTRRAREGN